MLKRHVPSFPVASVALQFTVVMIFEANELPEAGAHVITGDSSILSTATTDVNVTMLLTLTSVSA